MNEQKKKVDQENLCYHYSYRKDSATVAHNIQMKFVKLPYMQSKGFRV